jgi:hypothetical protein
VGPGSGDSCGAVSREDNLCRLLVRAFYQKMRCLCLVTRVIHELPPSSAYLPFDSKYARRVLFNRSGLETRNRTFHRAKVVLLSSYRQSYNLLR